jgi:hypothetical protein
LRGSLTLGLAFTALFIFFLFLVIMINTSGEATRFSKKTEKMLKAKYMAESAFGIAIVELAENRHRMRQNFKPGMSRALENLSAREFKIGKPYDFKCDSLEILSMKTSGFSQNSLGIIVRISVTGIYDNVTHKLTRTVQF